LAFYGAEVIYDGVPSSFYDLRIMNFESGDIDSPAGSDMEIYEKYIIRKSRANYFGRSLNTPLEFDLTLASVDPIDGSTRNAIQKLFLGRDSYKPFQIVQDDVANVVFYVLFTSATNKYIGNIQRAITLHGRCDSPYGRTFPKTLSYTFTGNNTINYDFSFYNASADSDYLYPIVEFGLNAVGNNFQLTNITDNNRIFLFTGIQPNETITVDNFRQTVVSDTGLLRLNAFNKNFFRLLPGNNILNIQSGIGTFSMTYTLNKNIGA
jgi:phage-related protein